MNVAKIDDNPTTDGYDGTVNVDSSTCSSIRARLHLFRFRSSCPSRGGWKVK